MTTILLKNNAYLVQFPYDPMMVQMLKNNIPGAGRKWDGNTKAWQVATQYENVLRQLFPNDRVPAAMQAQATLETRILDLRYLGQVKDRGNGEFTAFGYSNGNWSVIFPEATLKTWFCDGFDSSRPASAPDTFYGVLGLMRSASPDEIKTGYRRMARQWHPDICKEPNANEMFLKIREAFDVLSEPKKKARYDVGLSFQTQAAPIPKVSDQGLYRAPLRCGYVLAEGVDSLGRFQVKTILGWEDIVNAYGQILVSSWVMGDDKPLERWA